MLYLPTSVGLRYGHTRVIAVAAFLGSAAPATPGTSRYPWPHPHLYPGGFPIPSRLPWVTRHVHWARSTVPSASPLRSAGVVTEYKPFVHRLRLSASA